MCFMQKIKRVCKLRISTQLGCSLFQTISTYDKRTHKNPCSTHVRASSRVFQMTAIGVAIILLLFSQEKTGYPCVLNVENLISCENWVLVIREYISFLSIMLLSHKSYYCRFSVNFHRQVI